VVFSGYSGTDRYDIAEILLKVALSIIILTLNQIPVARWLLNQNLKSFSQVSSIKTFDFSTLYTTLPRDKLKSRLKETIHKVFSYRNYGSKFVVLGYSSTCFSDGVQKGKTCYSWSSSSMAYLSPLEGCCFSRSSACQWVRVVPLFLYSCGSEFLRGLVRDERIHEAGTFSFTYRCIDDVLSINGSRFAEFLPLMCPPGLEVRGTMDAASSASFLDLYLGFDDSGQVGTEVCDRRGDFSFGVMGFPSVCSSVPASPVYGVCISWLVRCARASSNYSDFLKRRLHLRDRLLDQGYRGIRLVRSLGEFIFRYRDLVEICSVSAEGVMDDGFSCGEGVWRWVVKNKNVKDIFLSMCDVRVFLTFASLGLVLLWQLFCLFCSSIVINTVIVTARDFEP
jgi:hypothetical protein